LVKSIISEEEYISKFRDIAEKISNALSSNEDFRYAFSEAIVAAYMSNINIITEVNSFLEYLKSITEERILLLDAINVLTIKPGSQKLIAEIRTIDLANNAYPPIDISMEVELDAEKEINIPLYSIFEWGRPS